MQDTVRDCHPLEVGRTREFLQPRDRLFLCHECGRQVDVIGGGTLGVIQGQRVEVTDTRKRVQGC